MIKKTFVAGIAAVALAGAVVATNSEAKANPLELGAAIVGGTLYAGAATVAAVAGAPYYAGPYYYGPYPYYWGNCGLVNRYDRNGYWVRTERVCH